MAEEARRKAAAEAAARKAAEEEAARRGDIVRARTAYSRTARLIAAVAASGAADAAQISTNGIVPAGPIEDGARVPPLPEVGPSPPIAFPPTPRPKPLVLTPPGAPMPIAPVLQ